jgi:hypothetical protein
LFIVAVASSTGAMRRPYVRRRNLTICNYCYRSFGLSRAALLELDAVLVNQAAADPADSAHRINGD